MIEIQAQQSHDGEDARGGDDGAKKQYDSSKNNGHRKIEIICEKIIIFLKDRMMFWRDHQIIQIYLSVQVASGTNKDEIGFAGYHAYQASEY